MDFRLSSDHEHLRQEVAALLDEHLTGEMVERAWSTGTLHDPTLHKALASRRWIGASWPEESGGLGMSASECGALWEALHYAGAPVDGQQITEMVGYVLVQVGTPFQKAEFLPKILDGDLLIALGYSEPDSGSDVAAAKTQAVRVDGGYLINGAKMFTTLAHASDYVFLLARTDPTVPKHRGLSMFLVPLDAPGIEIRPIETFGGERTNATFYDDVFVPETHRVGEENDGWRIIGVALDVERMSIGGYVGQARRIFDDLLDAITDIEPQRISSPAVRERLAVINVQIEAAAALADRVYCRLAKDEVRSGEAAMTKLFVTDVFKNLAHAALDLAGPPALLTAEDPDALAGGHLERAFRHSQVSTIYGGSNEIQRNIIAHRSLGLPRS